LIAIGMPYYARYWLMAPDVQLVLQLSTSKLASYIHNVVTGLKPCVNGDTSFLWASQVTL